MKTKIINLISKIIEKIKKSRCKHKNKTIIFEDYQDRFTKLQCNDCKKEIAEGWD